MSSMRNAVNRRNHKERAQPKQREKWGLLEKHKDYSLRAKDHKEKKRRIKILKQKAAERNPDEFHFAMMRSKTDDRGIKIADRGNQALSPEAVALLKTQDAGYLRTVTQKTKKAIARLEQTLTLAKTDTGDFNLGSLQDDEFENEHVTFVESVEEQKAWAEERLTLSSSLADKLQSDPQIEDLDSAPPAKDSKPPSKKSIRQAEEAKRLAINTRKRRRRDQEIRQTTLKILRKREKDLTAAAHQLEIQRSQMSGGHGISVTKKGVTFKNRGRKR